MLVKIFTLRFNPATESFDDAAVTAFLADKDVCAIRDHFFVKDDIPYVTLVVRYRPGALPPPAAPGRDGRQRDESWRETLSDTDWPLFNTLRDWRGERAKAEGVPSYVICNNRQLAAVVKARPTTLTALGVLEGFGEAKLKKYGKELLALIAGAARKSEGPSSAANEADRGDGAT